MPDFDTAKVDAKFLKSFTDLLTYITYIPKGFTYIITAFTYLVKFIFFSSKPSKNSPIFKNTNMTKKPNRIKVPFGYTIYIERSSIVRSLLKTLE